MPDRSDTLAHWCGRSYDTLQPQAALSEEPDMKADALWHAEITDRVLGRDGIGFRFLGS
jgi:hypothetical protein